MNDPKVPIQQTSPREIGIKITKSTYKDHRRKYVDNQSFELTMKSGGFCCAEIAHQLYEQTQHIEQKIWKIKVKNSAFREINLLKYTF